MLEFISSLPDFDQDTTTQVLWNRIAEQFQDLEGVCYYKHPVLGTAAGVMADLTLFTIQNQPIAIRCLPYEVEDIEAITNDYWVVNGRKIDSPLWELDDFAVALGSLIDLDRRLRRRLSPKAILAMPLITEADFHNEFEMDFPEVEHVIWKGEGLDKLLYPLSKPLSDIEWRSFRAVIQTATPLTQGTFLGEITKPTTLGAAARELERQIKMLDLDQEKVAVQIAPGPQRVRGLAGTGKTVLLAMRVANIHRHFPDKKILFTFSTRSLYNQVRGLIEQFYGVHKVNIEPDWTRVHIRHAWGGRNRPGVYSDLCGRQGLVPLDLSQAKRINSKTPFQACCEHALSTPIESEYDYIIVDEAQDFPKEFFRVLYQLSVEPHRIYWAYDELQNLASSASDLPSSEELFGYDKDGNALVVLDDEDYPGRIPKDFVLNKSYRCPQDVLMLAHALGLGLYNPKGCVQMLESLDSWRAIGYEVTQGELVTGKRVQVFRPPQNSPNRIKEIYQGEQSLITANSFDTRDDELNWVADSIAKNIREEDVAPEKIVVIVLDAFKVRDISARLQFLLVEHNIASTIPGVIDDADTYKEDGRVTISTVFRAKGNEAFIVYITCFEELNNYVEALENRNRAFTAISRSKAWVRISGAGNRMEQAKSEVDAILADIPYFDFTFPNMELIRSLDAETQKRRKKRAQGNRMAEEMLRNPDLFRAMTPDLLEQLKKALEDQSREN